MRKKFAAILSLVFLALPIAASQITAVPDDAAWAEVTTLQPWMNDVIAAQAQFATIPVTDKVHISVSKNGYGGAGCTPVFAITTQAAPVSPYKLDDPAFKAAAHELRHLQPCGGNIISHLFGEGMAQSSMEMDYYLLHQQDSSISDETSVPMADMKRLMFDPASIITEAESTDASNFIDYSDAAALFEMVSSGDFRAFDPLIGAISTMNTTAAELWQKYLDAADAAWPDFDGMKPSQFISSSPIAASVQPDGDSLQLLVTDDKFTSPIVTNGTTYAYIGWMVRERTNGVGKWRYDGKLKWSFTDPVTGKVLMSGLADSGQELGQTGYYFSFGTLPEGGYEFNGCWVTPGTTDCDSTKPLLTKKTKFGVLRNHTDNLWGYIWVFGKNLSLVKTDGDPTEVISLPGLLGVRLNGMKNDVLVTDGVETKHFTPLFVGNPVFTEIPSRFIPWSVPPRIAMMANAATPDTATSSVAPGSILSLFGVNLANDSMGTTSFPLPLTLANTSATVNGKAAPLFYASSGQVNVQVPYGLTGNTANVVVTSPQGSATASVALSPSSAAIFLGPNGEPFVDAFTYKWIPTADKQWITIWADGLGATSPAVPEGMPAPLSPLSVVAGKVSVQFCGQTLPADWAGLAPGMAGLYQINVWVPPATCSGQSNPTTPVITVAE
jgi:uncharacterized protein (TIGR03437 family)